MNIQDCLHIEDMILREARKDKKMNVIGNVSKGFDLLNIGEVIEVWSDGKTIVLLGHPPNEEEYGDTPEDEWHNCDQMGCSSLYHVLYRAEVTDAYWK